MKNIITDGYTQPGFIAAVERQHGELRFEFRPMLPEDVEATETEANRPGADPVKAIKLIAAQVAKHLVTWSETNEGGAELSISIEHVRRLRYPVLNKLYRIVSGMNASEVDPSANDDQQSDYAEAVIAEASGKSPQELLEADAKN